MSSQADQRFIVRGRRRGFTVFFLLLWSLGSLYAVGTWLVGYLTGVAQYPSGDAWLTVILFDVVLPAVFILIAVYLLWFSLLQLFSRRPTLRITAEGIVDNVMPLLRVGLIPWEEIIEVRAHKSWLGKSPRTLAIWLRDPNGFLQRKPAFLRYLIANSAGHHDFSQWWDEVPPTLNLDWRFVAGNLDELVDEIHAEFPLPLRAYNIIVRRDPRREAKRRR